VDLYRPEQFERLTDAPWDEGRVRDAIRAIVTNVESAHRGSRLLWPADPTSYGDGWNEPDPMTSLYQGAAGTIYALDRLRSRDLGETGLDLAALAVDALDLYRERPDFGQTSVRLREPRDAALLAGETGILLLGWRLAPSADLADRLELRIRSNVGNDAEDVMWGTPGTLLAAEAMFEWTQEERWRAVAQQGAEALLQRRDGDGLWTQHLYGEGIRRLDPIHGAVGIVLAIARALDAPAREALLRDAAALFARLAVLEDGLANWPVEAGQQPALLRWCAGAPGVVAATSEYLDEELLVAGAELIWRAGGPRMSSGPGICCGTSGNGYALLKVFERTGDERWLERARHFAVHALAQVARDRARGRPGWHSLWKGDPGVAVFAADCLDGRSAYPIVDGS
jgi:lanthionine synthetase-like protein